MKKTLVLSVLGLAAGLTSSSYGQGTIGFNTYTANNSNGILTTYFNVPGHNNGDPVASGAFTGQLLWSLTPISDPISDISNIGNPLTAGWTVGSTALSGAGIRQGYFIGPDLVIQSYTSGQVYFEVIAFNGADYDSSTAKGHSASFTQAMATGLTDPWPADGNPSALLGSGSGIYAPFQVWIFIPEPSTFALVGLGIGSLLLFRRRN